MKYSDLLIQILVIVSTTFILRYAPIFRWKQTWVVSLGLICTTYIMFETSLAMNSIFSIMEWVVISFINTIGWHMTFYCKEEKALFGAATIVCTPAIILGSMFQ